MYKVAYSILKDKILAEDAVQISFIKIMEHLDNIDISDKTKTRNFLGLICKNTAIKDNGRKLNFKKRDDRSRLEKFNYAEPLHRHNANDSFFTSVLFLTCCHAIQTIIPISATIPPVIRASGSADTNSRENHFQ